MHRFSIASKLDELSLLRDWVESTLRSSVVPRLTEEQIFQLQLAVQEAASNIISHSHCVDASPVVDVTLHFSEGKCQINLIYEGLAFDSAAVAPPSFDGSREGGFGVFIINELMDDVQYGRTAEHKNVIRLMKIVRSGEAQNHDRT